MLRFAVFSFSVLLSPLVHAQPLGDFGATYPSWSPDGRTVVFESMKDGSTSELYVIELEGRQVVRLTDNDFHDRQPVWSPDGSFIVFVSERDGNAEIYRMNADGSSQVRLTDYPKSDLHPRVAASGREMVFNRERGEAGQSTAEIFEMNMDGSNVKRLTENPLPYTYPSRSPHGGDVLFVQWFRPPAGGREPNTEIALLKGGQSEPVRLTDYSGFDGYPAWSPDGGRVAFSSDRAGGRAQIFVMRNDGSDLTQITDDETLAFARPSWSPDGSSIVCTGQADRTTQLYLVTVPAPGDGR